MLSVSLLADNTVCTTNLPATGTVQENDVITVACNITYSGNWEPVIRCFNSVTRENFALVTNNVTTDHQTTVTSQLMIAASASLQNFVVVCETLFTTTDLPTAASNIPGYTHTWTSSTFDVLCKQIRIISDDLL